MEDKKKESNTNKGIRSALKEHPGLARFGLFSIILLLLLIMVAIQTSNNDNGSSAASLEAQTNENSMVDEASKSADEDDLELSDDISDDNDNDDNNEDIDNRRDDISKNAQKNDAFDIIGTSLLEVEKSLGTGIAKNSPNRCYFISAGAYMVYDLESEIVTSVELDGSGDGRWEMSIAGVFIGDELLDAKNTLSKQGIDVMDLQENTFLCDFYFGSDKNTVYEIYAEANDEGKITSMSLSVERY